MVFRNVHFPRENLEGLSILTDDGKPKLDILIVSDYAWRTLNGQVEQYEAVGYVLTAPYKLRYLRKSRPTYFCIAKRQAERPVTAKI